MIFLLLLALSNAHLLNREGAQELVRFDDGRASVAEKLKATTTDCALWEKVCTYVFDNHVTGSWISDISECVVSDSAKTRACGSYTFNNYGYDDCKTMFGIPFSYACLEGVGMWMLNACKWQSYSQCQGH